MARPAREVHPCHHCGTPVEGPAGSFCCHGCEAAAAILADAGLSSWYATREQPAPRAGDAGDVAWDRLPVARHDDGTVSVGIAVDGFRCASCVWVTEKLLERTDGVAEAHVSYGSGRATLRWDPDRARLSELAGRIATLGYRPRPSGAPSEEDRDLLVRLGVATFSAMNVMGLSAAVYTGWLDGMDDRYAQLFRTLSLVVATPAVTWSAVPFFRGAWQGLQHRLLHMDLPIALAIALLYGHALVATFLHQDAYLDSVTMLVALLLGGRVLEARGRKRTAEAAASLAAVVPRTARRVVDDRVEEVPTEALQVGDRVDLGAGDEVPADGVVLGGRAQARMAVITGEAAAVEVGEGDTLVAGAVIEDGAVTLGVTRTGAQTVVQQLATELAAAADAPRTPTVADRLAPAFTGGTLVVATTTALWVAGTHGLDEALARAVAVLVVACPCALALASPLVGASGLGAAARRGLLLRGPEALEALADVDTVVLDKTGTVTWGRPRVVAADDEALRVAAGLERFSRHPIASAILEAAVARGVPIPVAEDVTETAGVGIAGRLDGRRWSVRRGGPDRVVVQGDDGTAWWIVLEDRPRDAAARDLDALRQTGREVILLTGDHAAVARRVADEVGVGDVVAEVDPRGKVDAIAALQRQGRRVLYVGDGLNDGPALAAADVGVAMSGGVASSVLAADGILAGERLAPLVAGLGAAPVVRRRVRAAAARSVTYNVLAVSAAVLGWVDPLVAAVLMPLSSGMVVATAAGVERAVARVVPGG